MASLPALLEQATRYWYIPAAVVILAALLGYGCAYFRAMGPRDGTLEWIALHDRPRFSLRLPPPVFRGRDVVALLALVLLRAAAWAGALLPPLLRQGPVTWPAVAGSLVTDCALPALGAALAFLLMRHLCASTAAAALGGAVLGLNLLAAPVPLVFVTAASLLVCRFVGRAEEVGFGANSPYLLLTVAALTAGCYFDPAISLFAAAILLLLLWTGAVRFIGGQRSGSYMVKLLLCAVAAAAVTTVVMYLPAAALRGLHLPQALVSADYYSLIAQRVSQLFSGLFRWRIFRILPGLYYDWPLLLTGLLATVAAVVSAIGRHDGRGLVLSLLFLGGLAMWLLSGSYVMPLVCTVALSCFWASLLQRGRASLTAVGAGILLVSTAAFNTCFFWYPQLYTILTELWR